MPDQKEDGYSLEGLIDDDTVEVSESQIIIYPSKDSEINKENVEERSTITSNILQ